MCFVGGEGMEKGKITNYYSPKHRTNTVKQTNNGNTKLEFVNHIFPTFQ